MSSFRVTQHLAAATARRFLGEQSNELFRVQQQISSGVRIQRPADDPVAVRRSLIQRDRLERINAQVTSLTHVQSRLEQSHVQLREAGSLILRARNVALSAQQATDPAEIQVLAAELNGVLEQLDSVANSSDETGYLFAGTALQVRPFPDVLSSDGQTHYAGTGDPTELLLAGDIRRLALQPGNHVFQPIRREATVLVGNATGAASAGGPDTGIGFRDLVVRHTLTTFDGVSGVQAGTSSASKDTIIGATGTHSLQIVDTSGTGAGGTVALNGGDPVPFTSADTDLRVTGPGGESVYLNTTSIQTGFSGTVQLTGTGTISLDGGASAVPVNFGSNELLVDSRDGSVVHLDLSGVRRTGTDYLEFTGTGDVFAAVRNLRDDLLNTRGLSSSDRSGALERRLGDLDRVHDHVLDVIGVQSVSLEQIERLRIRSEDLGLAEELALSETVSTDFTAAVLRLRELQTVQEFTMAAVGRLLTPNLLNFLQ